MNIRISKLSLFKIFTTFVGFIGFVYFFTSINQFSTVYATQESTSTLNIHLFYSNTCPHCAKEELFLSKLETKYPNLKINRYEVSENSDNLNLFINVGQKLGDKSGRVPFLVIGTDYIVGYLDDGNSGAQIEAKIQESFTQPTVDLVGEIITQNKQTSSTSSIQVNSQSKPKEKFEINLPVIGKIDLNSLTLPVLTVVVGTLDGFNPCALWVLLFLISMLIGTKDRLKMWLLAGTFILTSAIVYYVFMAAWLNLFLVIGYAPLVRTLIGVFALGSGGYYLWDYYKNQSGCEAEGYEKRQIMFAKIRKITEKDKLIMAIIGIIALAVAVNIVELLCSIGLPAVYTRALTMAHMPTWKYYAYLAAYVFFFILQDLIIFSVAMFSLETIGIKQKYAKYSHLIGGIIIFLLGLAMLFKPGLLTLNL